MNKKQTGLHCPITGTYWNKRSLIGTGIMVAIMMVVGNIWHGFIMGDLYQSTPWLWRAYEEMNPWLISAAMVAIAVLVSVIFHHGYKGGHWREGARFGTVITLLMASGYTMAYATQPMPLEIVLYWVAGDALTYIPGGIAMAWWFGRK